MNKFKSWLQKKPANIQRVLEVLFTLFLAAIMLGCIILLFTPAGIFVALTLLVAVAIFTARGIVKVILE